MKRFSDLKFQENIFVKLHLLFFFNFTSTFLIVLIMWWLIFQLRKAFASSPVALYISKTRIFVNYVKPHAFKFNYDFNSSFVLLEILLYVTKDNSVIINYDSVFWSLFLTLDIKIINVLSLLLNSNINICTAFKIFTWGPTFISS